MNLLMEVENLKGNLKIPEIENPYLQVVWINGRNAGITKLRNHVKRHPQEKLPFLKTAPKGVRNELGQVAADVWLNGYNAPIEALETKINVMIFQMTHGKVLFAR